MDQRLTQQVLAQAARQITVSVEVVSNFSTEHCPVEQGCVRLRHYISLPENMPNAWAIYFSHVSPVVWQQSSHFVLEHVNGDLHRLTPQQSRMGKGTYTLEWLAGGWQVSVAGIFPHYVLTAPGAAPVVIDATRPHAGEVPGLANMTFVAPFTKTEQQLRRAQDRWPLDNAEQRYRTLSQRQVLAPLAEPLSDLGVLPTPRHMTAAASQPRVSVPQGIALGDLQRPSLVSLLAFWQLPLNPDGIKVQWALDNHTDPEQYRLEITPQGIHIRASSVAGLDYALFTLAQLYDASTQSLPATVIEDAPRYAFRSLHIDVARHFRSADYLKRLIDVMALLKLNHLQLHLADDEGWRIEIPGLPELTDIGATRCFDLQEHRCLLPQLGTDVSRESAASGYLSRAAFVALLRYANERHIRVIPAIDMPGHARAAIVSMRARTDRLMRAGQQAQAEEYQLHEEDDHTVYRSVQHYRDNTLNPCIPGTRRFVNKVVKEMKAMYQDAGVPLSYFHLGADETAGAWVDSPQCQRQMTPAQAVDSHQVAGDFVASVANDISTLGVMPAAWSDGVMNALAHSDMVPTLTNVWASLADNAAGISHQLINRGWPVVLSLPDILYFDFPHAADPLEPGYYWGARAIDSFAVFQLMPDNLPGMALWRTDRMGVPLVTADPIPRAADKRLFGLQAQLWSETVMTDAQADYQLFPRLLAFAERAWHEAAWEVPYQPGRGFTQLSSELPLLQRMEWRRVSARIAQQWLPTLISAGYVVRVPLPGAIVEQQQLLMLPALEGLINEYRLEHQPWQKYEGPVSVAGTLRVRSRIEGTDYVSREQRIGSDPARTLITTITE